MSLNSGNYSYDTVQDGENTFGYDGRKTRSHKCRYGCFLAVFLLVVMLAAPVVALSWTTKTVDSKGDVGRYTSLASRIRQPAHQLY